MEIRECHKEWSECHPGVQVCNHEAGHAHTPDGEFTLFITVGPGMECEQCTRLLDLVVTKFRSKKEEINVTAGRGIPGWWDFLFV